MQRGSAPLAFRAGTLLTLLTLGFAAASGVGCDKLSSFGGSSKGAPKPTTAPAAPPPMPVRTMTVTARNVPVEFTEVGKTVASRRVEVRSRIAGFIKKRHFEEGKFVKEGELLFEIDPREFEVALQQEEAALARAQAGLDLAEQDVRRLTPLVQSKSVSQRELDDAEARRKTFASDVAAARANIARANLNLSYTKVYSPVDGIVGFTEKQEGAYVDDGQNSMLVMTMQTDPMYVVFSIPEKTMLEYRHDVESGRLIVPPGNNFTMILELLDGSRYEKPGKLTITGFEVGSTTGTALYRAEVPNPDGTLIDGQFVRVHAQGASRPNTIAIPQRAVQMGDQGTFVYVVVDGKAQVRPVVTDDWSPPNWVIKSGLQEGDVVITDGFQKIGPGSPVMILPPDADNPSAASPATQPAGPNGQARGELSGEVTGKTEGQPAAAR